MATSEDHKDKLHQKSLQLSVRYHSIVSHAVQTVTDFKLLDFAPTVRSTCVMTRPTLTKHHILQRTVKETNVQKGKDKCSEKCTKHEKVIKYYCPRHDYFGCSVCITLQHRQCEDVVYISEVSKNFSDSKMYQGFTEKLKTIKTNSEELVPQAEQNKEYVNTNHQAITATIQAFRKLINDAFDALENSSTAEALKAKEEETRKFQGITATCNEMLEKIQKITARLEDLVGRGQLCDAYMAMKRADTEIEDLVKKLATLKETCYLVQYMFSPHERFLPNQEGLSTLGTLSTMHDTSNGSKMISYNGIYRNTLNPNSNRKGRRY